MSRMRPCFLVIDNEYPGSISTGKLVIESAKFNVITVYSGKEALETLRRFPRSMASWWMRRSVIFRVPTLSAICGQLALTFPSWLSLLHEDDPCNGEHHGKHHLVSSFDPKALLLELQKLCPNEYRCM